MEKITLVSHSGNAVQLKLNSTKKTYHVEEILSIQNKVYSDLEYIIKLESDREISEVVVYINGEMLSTDYREKEIRFCGESRNAFSNIIGLAQISMYITYSDDENEWLYSDFVSVLIKSTDTNKMLDLMLKYVYLNQVDILHRDMNVTGIGQSKDNAYDDFWSQIILYEEIANVYETGYGYFKANCRYKLEKVDVLDSVEKLHEINSRTIQYITQHPEYLRTAVTGIKNGRQCFLPSKTLMSQKKITYDIYENQVVISFLDYTWKKLKELLAKINEYIDMLYIENETENGYIVSSYLLYENAKTILVEFSERLLKLEKQYHQLMISYANILNVKHINMDKKPDASAIFMNVPQYNRVYTCILRWHSKKGYDLVNEKNMLNFINASSIYEAYVLIKLINQIKDSGYELIETKYVQYPRQSQWMYRHQEYNNTYIFASEDERITLYYEPIIYDEDRIDVNNIGLYRNNSVSLNKDTDDERQGRYYVPDYIIKYEDGSKEQYMICDAKFSKKKKVKFQLMPQLIYKYISSISTIETRAEIKGLLVFYGLNEENNCIESFYDKHIEGSKNIIPQIDLLPLSENLTYSEQENNATEMLKKLVGGI